MKSIYTVTFTDEQVEALKRAIKDRLRALDGLGLSGHLLAVGGPAIVNLVELEKKNLNDVHTELEKE